MHSHQSINKQQGQRQPTQFQGGWRVLSNKVIGSRLDAKFSDMEKNPIITLSLAQTIR